MSKSQNRQDDGRRDMPKITCPVCKKRTIDCSDEFTYHQCELHDYRIARKNNKYIDYVIVCPNTKCNAVLSVTIKAFHSPRFGYVNIPIIGTVIS